MDERPICMECRWHGGERYLDLSRFWLDHRCMHPDNVGPRDPVTGDRECPECSEHNTREKPCGLFEPEPSPEPEPVPWHKRLLAALRGGMA